MQDSRRIDHLREDLQGPVQLMLLRYEKRTGIRLAVTSTLRTLDRQARLYRQGRTTAAIEWKAEELRQDGYSVPAAILLAVGPQSGPVVTHAAPGESLHQWGAACDVVPIVDGAAFWDTTTGQGRWLWTCVGEIALEVGLAWGGNWSRPDRPHVELPDFDWRAEMRKRLHDGSIDGIAMVAT